MDLDFSKQDGLVTAVIQDYKTGRVLMVGYMNEESFRITVTSDFACFYSRLFSEPRQITPLLFQNRSRNACVSCGILFTCSR